MVQLQSLRTAGGLASSHCYSSVWFALAWPGWQSQSDNRSSLTQQNSRKRLLLYKCNIMHPTKVSGKMQLVKRINSQFVAESTWTKMYCNSIQSNPLLNNNRKCFVFFPTTSIRSKNITHIMDNLKKYKLLERINRNCCLPWVITSIDSTLDCSRNNVIHPETNKKIRSP